MGSCTVERELFYDGFESGGARWSMDPVWTVGVAAFYRPCAGDREMIAGFQFGCIRSGDATLISPIDISRATALTLTQQSRSGLGATAEFTISGSADGGRTWTVVGSQGPNTCGVRSTDLGSFVGRSTLLLRFSYFLGDCRDQSATLWRLDEVRVRALVRNY
jgi:hypothetical protein